MPSEKLLFSVIVCTYNRADLLQVCLSTIVLLDYPENRFEILIIDNNSNDNTRRVSQLFYDRHLNTRYFFEAEQGLSHARNRGVCEAKGRYLAYIDDECKVGKDWLKNAENVIETTGARIFGGPYKPWYEAIKPLWFKDEYGTKKDNKTITGWLGETEYISGGNMFIEKTLFDEYGLFKPDLGMKGKNYGFGEETEFQNRIRKETENNSYYDDSLLIWHGVRKEKTSLGFRFKSVWQYGLYEAENKKLENDCNYFLMLIINVVKTIYLLLFASLLRNRKLYPFIQNFMYEVIALQIRKISYYYHSSSIDILKLD